MNVFGARHSPLGNQQGIVMLAAVVFLSLLSAIGIAYHANMLTALKLEAAEGRERVGFYAAEAGLNVGITRLSNMFELGQVPDSSDLEQTLTVGATDVEVSMAEVANCSPCAATRIPFGEPFGGMNTIPYGYTVQSTALNSLGQTEAHVGAEFMVNSIPLFQFLAFINNHLFIMPITASVMNGRIHSNSNIYLDEASGVTLSIEDSPEVPDVQMTATGDIYRGGRKYSSSWQCNGTVTMDAFTDNDNNGSNDPMAISCGSSDGSPLSDATIANWQGSIDKVANIVTPDAGIFTRLTGEYWKGADLRIVLNMSAGVEAIDFNAGDLCPGAPNLFTDTNAPAPGVTVTTTNLFPIQVQNLDGSVNVTKTRALWRFMCERRGAIFYNELPTGFGNTTQPNDAWASVDGADFANYRCNGGSNDGDPCTPSTGVATCGSGPWTDPTNGVTINIMCYPGGTSAEYNPRFPNYPSRAFRRMGEDTNGDGVVNNTDNNPDICPPPGTIYDWWRPAYCA